MKGTEAIDHVRDEMAKSESGYTRMLGELMTAWLRMHPDAEIDEKKTLAGAYAALKETARKKQTDGCYAMANDEAFEGMMEYYGIAPDNGDFNACMAAMYGAQPEAQPKAAHKPDTLGLTLDELLGE